jgi:hypothetical protein
MYERIKVGSALVLESADVRNRMVVEIIHYHDAVQLLVCCMAGNSKCYYDFFLFCAIK